MSGGPIVKPVAAHPVPSLAAVLRGEDVRWRALGMSVAALLDVCATEELGGLLYERMRRGGADDWPPSVHEELERAARVSAARELVRRREIRAALDSLASAGVTPILLKGTALAYSVYDTPWSRPRADTDLFIAHDQIDTVRKAMSARGYNRTPYCDGLFNQFELAKIDRFGIDHAFDFHWKISTQSTFANLLIYEELAARAVAVPPLGPHARTAAHIDALLLACIHPVMHHRNVERLLWIYDVHLLASRLSDDEFDSFAELAIAKGVAAIAAHELSLAQTLLKTPISPRALERLRLRRDRERSAVYLRHRRRWHHELASNFFGLDSWRDRLKLVREVLLPNPGYVLTRYGIRHYPLAAALLPALYIHRAASGLLKVLTGRK